MTMIAASAEVGEDPSHLSQEDSMHARETNSLTATRPLVTLAVITALAVLILPGCASTGDMPREQMAVARAAVDRASGPAAAEAPVEVSQARDKLERANAAVARKTMTKRAGLPRRPKSMPIWPKRSRIRCVPTAPWVRYAKVFASCAKNLPAANQISTYEHKWNSSCTIKYCKPVNWD